ncbi:hypothetical protein SAMN05216411_11533 [Nitrosospira multiformis]|nr:hypothetical protein SAMN05216411_11533 [Nitrosospira multiformis]
MKIYRIFQQQYHDDDVKNGCLTLPRATASVWNDPLENPLASVTMTDLQTGQPLHLGSVVSRFSCISTPFYQYLLIMNVAFAQK